MENPERVTYFAATDSRGKRIPFGIKQKDRSRHMYVIGKTGMGKSTLLENMAIQDIRNGEGS
jgi:type IV secretory pathway VirB4 component